MKFYSNQVVDVANNMLKGSMAAALVYGQDRGLVDYSVSQIAEVLKLPKRTISYADISFDELKSELNNISLFGTKEIIKLQDIPTFDAKLKDLVKANNHHMLVITAEELTPASALRKAFETEANLASIACYHDDVVSVERIARKSFADAKKRIAPDALKYISHSLYGDRYIIINEIEKLLTYVANSPDITLIDVQNVLSGSTTAEPDMLCMYFFKNDRQYYLEELAKLLAENVSAVWIVRALIRYSINIYFTLQKMSDGMSLADAITSMSPPIFFKYVADFRQIVSSYDRERILKIMEALYKAEIALKSTGANDRLICEGLLFV